MVDAMNKEPNGFDRSDGEQVVILVLMIIVIVLLGLLFVG
jgi:hypothetical protein